MGLDTHEPAPWNSRGLVHFGVLIRSLWVCFQPAFGFGFVLAGSFHRSFLECVHGELRNRVERAMALCDDVWIGAQDLFPELCHGLAKGDGDVQSLSDKERE